MGDRGFCRIRPVHVAGLVKRYHQLLGEKRYVEIHYPSGSPRIAMLTRGLTSLVDVIEICEPNSTFSILRPIPFRIPTQLPDTALPCAVLAVLHDYKDGLTADLLSASIAERYKLFFSEGDAEHRFTSRINRLLNSVITRGDISTPMAVGRSRRTALQNPVSACCLASILPSRLMEARSNTSAQLHKGWLRSIHNASLPGMQLHWRTH